MLNTLRIQNLALIPAVEINFGEHFNVLTGETGAGKSIIIGSLNFIFGDKLSVNAIRHGADFARVTAVFDDTIIVVHLIDHSAYWAGLFRKLHEQYSVGQHYFCFSNWINYDINDLELF